MCADGERMQMTDWLAGGFVAILLLVLALAYTVACDWADRRRARWRPRVRGTCLDDGGAHRILAEIENGPGANNRSVEQLARHITAGHRRYGEVKLDQTTFDSFIRNFNDGVYGQRIFVDVAHEPDKGSAAEIVKVWADGDKLLAELDWTPKGVKAFNEDGFRYFSIEFDDYTNPETGTHHGPTLFGAGLVTRPFIKNMAPSEGPGRMYFSEDGKTAVPGYLRVTEAGDMNKFLKKLREQLKAKGLANSVIEQIAKSFEAHAKALGEDEAQLSAACDVWIDHGAKLADDIGGKEVTLKIDAPDPAKAGQGGGATTLSEDDVDKRVAKLLADREEKAAKDKADADKKLGEVKASFDTHLDNAKGLSEDVRDQLKQDWHPTLSADTSDAQIKQFADLAIKSGNQQAATAKLSDLGYDVGGSGSHVDINDEPIGKKLSDTMRTRLGNSNGAGRLRLPEHDKLSPFARQVLGEFDRANGRQLTAEAKKLAGEDGVHIADGEFPKGAQRQVILETLSDLRILDLVSTNVDPQAQATTQIPYETRNTGAVRNDGVVHEGQPIPFAGVQQRMDVAYIQQRKIAMLMSNEMIHFSAASQIDWNAWARNIASNARLNRELIARAIANTMQRAADSYMAQPVTGETADPAAGTGIITLANFPVVRPHQPRDLQGNVVGPAENPIEITVGGNDVPAWDGSGDQPAGTYYRLASVNMGKLQLVNAQGAAVTDAGQATVAYSYATNLVKVDLDTPQGVDRDKHLNEIIFAVGRRKAYLADDLFVTPNFGLSSNTLNETATEAEAFTAGLNRPGVNADTAGMLSSLKGVPFWATNEPGIDMGDERMLIGERGTLGYTIAKPFQTGTPFEAVARQTGNPTGQKVAYGEEYSAIHVPKPTRERMTSVLVYSASQR